MRRNQLYKRISTILSGAVAMFLSYMLYEYRRMDSNPTNPVLSVIIPCYNCERWLSETLASLEKQTFQEFTVVFIDDGSKTPVKLQTLRLMYKGELKLLRHARNMGLSAARNTGVMAARNSKFIIFLDPDDLIEPTAFEKLLLKKAYDDDQRCAFIYPAVTNFRVDETNGSKHVVGIDKSPYSKELLFDSNFITSFALIDREIYVAAGGMCERIIKWWEDYDFWLRLANLGFHGVLLPDPVFWYRRHNVGRSSYINRNISQARWRLELMVNNPAGLPDVDDEIDVWDEGFVPPCYRELDTSPFTLLGRVSPAFHFVSRFLPSGRSQTAYRALRNLKFEPFKMPTHHLHPLVSRESILLVVPWLQIGGGDVYDLDMIKVLSERLHVIIVTEIQIEKHQNIHAFSKITKDIFHLPDILDETDPDHDARVFNLFTLLVESRNVKHIYCRNSFAGYKFFENAARTGLKDLLSLKFYDVQHVHYSTDNGGWEHTTVPYHQFIDKRIVISEDLRDQQQVPSSDFAIVPPSIDMLFWNSSASQCQDYEGFTVMFIGRVDEQKDPLKWVRVARETSKLHPSASFLVVGDGPLLAQMQADAQDLDIKFTQRFLGPLEIRNVLESGRLETAKSCRKSVLLMTSKFEGLPIVMLEAIAMGVPIVSTPVGAIDKMASVSNGLLHIAKSPCEFDLVASLHKLMASQLETKPSTFCSKAFADMFGRETFAKNIRNIFI